MADQRRSASEIVAELRAELEQAEVADPVKQERLRRLLENLDARLDQGIEDEPQHELMSELREEAVEFAVEHPDLAATLRGVLRMLSSIGI